MSRFTWQPGLNISPTTPIQSTLSIRLFREQCRLLGPILPGRGPAVLRRLTIKATPSLVTPAMSTEWFF